MIARLTCRPGKSPNHDLDVGSNLHVWLLDMTLAISVLSAVMEMLT